MEKPGMGIRGGTVGGNIVQIGRLPFLFMVFSDLRTWHWDKSPVNEVV